ncbi:MAG TPA: hypothetical protein VNA30_05070 [Mycobacteriales bacterium]|nr:hypothetical protein [Mycobacteriales bacterium]
MSDSGYFAAPAAPSPPPPGGPPPPGQQPPGWQPPTPPSRSGSPLRRAVAAAALLAVSVAAVATVATSGTRAGAQVSALHALTDAAPASAGWGPAYRDDKGRPARWDPCKPIRYVVHRESQPPTARADISAALARISKVSGLTFVDDGDTDEAPSQGRESYQPKRYGERWAPVLIAWVSPADTDIPIGKGVRGLASAVAVSGKTGGSILTAQVVLDGSAPMASGFGPGETQGEVLLHEFAHVVGLGHVLDATQVMYPVTTNAESEFGAGDRAGLVALGADAGCHPAPKPRS